MDQTKTPLFEAMRSHYLQEPLSFHVPGHKNGVVFPDRGYDLFKSILSIDYTEIKGLDDLHEPEGCILDAQALAAEWFGVRKTYFLIGGSTVGNLAMILASHKQGRPVIVQRNCHKSVMHGLELAGDKPIFVSPTFDKKHERMGNVCVDGMLQAIEDHPNASGVVLTYPDYFGRTYKLQTIINRAHDKGIPVMVDEAHGVHFSLGNPMPLSAVQMGADVVVQSAHKMAPAMTMGAYLHISSSRVHQDDLSHYLHMLQSSSPSYPIMASLDLARYYLGNIATNVIRKSVSEIQKIREGLADYPMWRVLPMEDQVDDPFKLTLHIEPPYSATEIASQLEKQGIYSELVTENQLLFVFGLSLQESVESILYRFQQAAQNAVTSEYVYRATIEDKTFYESSVVQAPYSFHELKGMDKQFVAWQDAEGKIAAHSIIPYPPGIPLIMKGERILSEHMKVLQKLLNQKRHVQTNETSIEKGIHIYKNP
ncbi:aminotransferase class V-fold PLP-dependent enzyme [Pontibacillus yanchengensis]|uniref:Aminotransferase class V-fold PLP-dependent enzyme n=2 Tax=Pontibacillus yanchengensis TaxID=462910 RepID=A0ACC7VLV1_9BACI|nr:aminotransferase class V-fold PLP-dependent enzyme [Pontibacillus yanchengensis]MYL35926.1 aminotransferase class V-fold PLP-dependent enzyme [Pontibacillus yanchengensis]MYL55812.1 aminotransferase class V-fold PLP-dependent enzyme [Pontibacillus yanchengensis]